MNIPLCKPYYDEKEVEVVKEVIESGMVCAGRVTEEFEKSLATHCGVTHAVATNSCTSALQLALMGYGIKGGEVITTDYTFTSTAMVAHMVGSKPVLTDVDEDTRNINPELVKPNASTKGIISVDVGGHPCDYDMLRDIARDWDIPFISDAAHSIGSTYNTIPVGGLADATCMSFHGTKNIAIGEGGAILTDDTDLYERLLLLRDCGTSTKSKCVPNFWFYSTVNEGMSLLLPDTLAAIGLVQLGKLKKINKLRNKNSKIYSDLFSEVGGVQLPTVRGNCTSSFHLYTIRLDNPPVRDEVLSRMKRLGVQCDVHYLPLHMHTFYVDNDYSDGVFPVSERIYKSTVTLPMYPDLEEEEIHYVVECLKKALRYC